MLTKYDTELYEENSSASHLFIRDYKDDTYRVIDYNNPKLYPNPVYQKGYEYKADAAVARNSENRVVSSFIM